jgi:hypothetical protein
MNEVRDVSIRRTTSVRFMARVQADCPLWFMSTAAMTVALYGGVLHVAQFACKAVFLKGGCSPCSLSWRWTGSRSSRP